MIEILFGLSIVFLIALIGYIYIQSRSSSAASTPISYPPVVNPSVPYPPVTTPPPVTYPDPVIPRSRLATVNGRDFLCPTGYYYEGDGTQQACVKEGTSGFVCPSGWNQLAQKPFCSFNVDSSGNDSAVGGDTSAPAIIPVPPINDQSATPATDPPPPPASAPAPIDRNGKCSFGTCDKFDSLGNCIAYADGGYHCKVNDLDYYSLEDGTKIFETISAPINPNALGMCYKDSNGNLLQRNGKYVCKFAKGNAFRLADGSAYLNVYNEDIGNGYQVSDVSAIPSLPIIPTMTLNMIYADNPWRETLWPNTKPNPTGYLTSAKTMKVYDPELIKLDKINSYIVYGVFEKITNGNSAFSVGYYAVIVKGLITNQVSPNPIIKFALKSTDAKNNIICSVNTPYYRETVSIGSTTCGTGWAAGMVF